MVTSGSLIVVEPLEVVARASSPRPRSCEQKQEKEDHLTPVQCSLRPSPLLRLPNVSQSAAAPRAWIGQAGARRRGVKL